jgi:hypothetical protein
MEANAPPLPGGESPAPCPGELVVQNGRHAGTRRPLSAPLTLLGQAAGCDIRLNTESVSPLHCAIFQGPFGLILRDLGSDSGTLVNDQLVGSCLLREGDVLSVGPFHFRVHCPEQPPVAQVVLPGDWDALRVQAAAVAAQQAALLEEENRLQQQRTALEKQEEQLAAHLDERRQNLLAMQEEVRQEQAVVQKERAAFEQERRGRLEEATRHRDETARTLKQAQAERNRLLALRRRLRQRWRRHWDATEKALAGRQRDLSRECQQLQSERAQLTQARLRFNAEAELGRRQLRDGWDELGKARREWLLTRQHEEAELGRQRREIHAAREVLAAAQQAATDQQARSETARVNLEREVDGLENRIRNLRLRLAEYEGQLALLGQQTGNAPPPTAQLAALPPGDSPPLSEESAEREERLEKLAAVLADQRLHLAEQWESFLRAQQAWHEEHAGLEPRFEEAARNLQERERCLVEQEQAQAVAAEELRARQRTVSQLRSELEAWQARLGANESAWRTERASVLAQIQTRETLAHKRETLLEALRKRWAARRKQELDLMARELKRAREAQRRYVELSDEVEQHTGELAVRERSLAERTLALEQLQLETFGRSENSAAAERRLQKLHRQIANLQSEAEGRLAERRQTLEDEAERLRAQAHHLHLQAEGLLAREGALAGKQREWEKHRLDRELAQAEQHQELLRLREHGEAAAQHEKELQEVIERVIRVLLEEADAVPPTIRAA